MTGSIEKRGKSSYRLIGFKGHDLDGRAIRHKKKQYTARKNQRHR